MLVLASASGTVPITLQHVGQRWYQPEVGRLAQLDPLGVGAGLNPYAYCGNESIASTDPTGFDRWYHSEGGVHLGVTVGPIGGEYYEVDFGASGFDGTQGTCIMFLSAALAATVGAPGTVSIVPTTQRPTGQPVVFTNPVQDIAVLHWALEFKWYVVWGYNCRTFSGDAMGVGIPPPNVTVPHPPPWPKGAGYGGHRW